MGMIWQAPRRSMAYNLSMQSRNERRRRRAVRYPVLRLAVRRAASGLVKLARGRAVRYAALGLVGLVGLAGAVLLIWRVPPTLYNYAEEKDRAAAEASTRTGLIAGLAGLAALGGLAFTARTYRLTAEGQITDRYTKAIEQLGSDKLDVRLGGVYALERIARDSKRDHSTVVEVLSAFVREHSDPAHTDKKPTVAEIFSRLLEDAGGGTEKPKPATDVQAAVTVLGRLPERSDVSRGDLSGAQLAGALVRPNLSGARLVRPSLSGARLVGTNLSGARLVAVDLSFAQLSGAKDLTGPDLNVADLRGADLEGANLSHAHLELVTLKGAHLEGADLSGAHLKRALLRHAHLQFANLAGADLQEAWLVDAHLEQANLRGADLKGAWLYGTNLRKAILYGANLEGATLAGAHLEGAMASKETTWPVGFDWQAAGVDPLTG
jgi:uncharacterized protein YjbI with pentapeptide repeats